jgi:SAM-dependent methyltransferase
MSKNSSSSKLRSLFKPPHAIGGYIQSTSVFIATGLGVHIILDHLWPELSEPIRITLALVGATLLERAYSISYEGKARFEKFMRDFDSSMLLAAPIVGSLYEISSLSYSKALERHFRDQNLSRQVKALFDEWRVRIALRQKWRLIFELHLDSEVKAIKNNSLSLPLATYLEILRDVISVSLEEANESKGQLIVRSFTNARPKDWFDAFGAPSAAKLMAEYRSDLQILVKQMRDAGHRYDRHVLCSPSRTLSGHGFSDVRTVEKGWLQLTEEEKERYYSVHSQKEMACYVDLDEQIAFCNDHTEFIYFGFKTGTQLSWEWCFCCFFTNNNLNVSASFVDMTSTKNSSELVVDVKNDKRSNPKKEFAPPEKLQVSFQDFPSAIDDDLIGRKKQFKTVASLAAKWHRAALIWHDERETQVLTDYLKAQLSGGSTVLDCACGTGFHALLLSKIGFAVTASDIDPDNITILKGQPEYLAKPFTAQVADWKRLTSSISSKFDCVLCLGSSITYYDSWREDTEVKMYNPTELALILRQMKGMLKPNGKLIIGISRYYDRKLNSLSCTFADRPIQNIQHSMRWHLSYDWQKGQKTWLCEIRNEKREDYSFTLSSYLFDARNLKEICQQVFENPNVSIMDVDSMYYDIFVVSRNA